MSPPRNARAFAWQVLVLDLVALALLAWAGYCLVADDPAFVLRVGGKKVLSVKQFERPLFFAVGLVVLRAVYTAWRAPEAFRARYRTRLGRLKPRLAMFAGMLVLALSIAEAGYNYLHDTSPPPSNVNLGTLWKDDASGFLPMAQAISGGASCVTDSFGFRCRPARPSPSPTARRILALGDSFTYGTGLPVEQTFLCVAEDRLRERGQDVFVFNAGIPGYRTIQEQSQLVNYGLAVDPDVVVLFWCMNDAVPDLPPWPRPLYNATGRLHLLGWVCERLFSDPEQNNPAAIDRCYEDDQPLWIECRESILEMRDLARERGFEFRVVVFPYLEFLDSDAFAFAYEALDRFFESEGIRYRNWRPLFEGRVASELWVHPKDHHPGPEAARIAGEDLADFLEPDVRGAAD